MIRRRKTKAIAATAGLAVVIGLVAAGTGSARETIVLGSAAPAKAACPSNCLVEASVTGYQTAISGAQNPFVVPADGSIVAWSLKLGFPKKPDRRAFNDEFGTPTARLAILRKVPGSGRPFKYKLLRQSPVQNLGKFFGDVTTFNLTRALPVKKNDVVALSIPSWAPALALGQPNSSTWLASRRATKKRGGCTQDGGANVDAGAAQVKKGSQRPYGCTYSGARLLYSAQFVSSL